MTIGEQKDKEFELGLFVAQVIMIVGSGMIWIFAEGGQIGPSEFEIETRAELTYQGANI